MYSLQLILLCLTGFSIYVKVLHFNSSFQEDCSLKLMVCIYKINFGRIRNVSSVTFHQGKRNTKASAERDSYKF